MKKIRVITTRHRETQHPHVFFLDDFDTPVETFLLVCCELVSDTIIEVKNWPDDFPMGFRLLHDPHLMVQLADEYKEVTQLEEQWRPEPEPSELPEGVFEVEGLRKGLYNMNISGEVIERDDRRWEIIGTDEDGAALVKELL